MASENSDATQLTSVPPSTTRSHMTTEEQRFLASRPDLSTDEMGGRLRKRFARRDEVFGGGGGQASSSGAWKPVGPVGGEGTMEGSDGAGVTRESTRNEG
ncbi:hypothetical protein B9479_005896 [Cryptococcus floricola]|uniref:Uncharacterized protein n=1 Tax=Cryptococcus floricola TaxID=2591691 RepID=A0A5D3ARM1_9TREE|nr:hypothetical protein B9479_005896 [Cryptococcus floricola]